MKKVFFIFFFLILFLNEAFGQLVVGDALTLGTGSANDGSFSYVLTKNYKKKGNYANGTAIVEGIDKFHPFNLPGGIWIIAKIKGLKGKYNINVDSAIKYGEVIAVNGQPAKDYNLRAYAVTAKEDNEDFDNEDTPMGRLVNSIDQGVVLTLGVGTMPNGDFAFVKTSETSWLALASMRNNGTSDAIFHLGGDYGGLKVTVKKTHEFGNHKFGFKKIAIVAGGNIVNYQVDLFDAIRSGEVVAVNGKPIDRNGEWLADKTVSITAPKPDKAQRLLEWKKLLDSGGISQHEYDSIKNQLLKP